MANIVLSSRKINFCIGSMLPFLFTSQTQEIILRASILDDIIFKTKWWQEKNKMADIVFSSSKINFCIGSMLPFLFTSQTQEIILRASILDDIILKTNWWQ